MKSCISIFGLSMVAVATVVLAGCDAGGEEKFEKIELKEVYSTNGQKGVKDPTRNTQSFLDLMEVGSGGPNILLVRGDDINQAIDGTATVFLRRKSADKILLGKRGPGLGWMVVHWGAAHSDPPFWKVHSVERSDKIVRLRYVLDEDEQGIRSTDIRAYYAWIPIGEINAGKYELQLWDHKRNEKILTRVVLVHGATK